MPAYNSVIQWFRSFQPGVREVDGGDCLNMANILFSAKTGITALSGGGQAGATQLVAAYNRVDTVAVNSDSVALPQAIPGLAVTIYNNTANTLAVFGLPTNPITGVGDTIAANNSNTQQATATGVTQATTTVAIYQCYVAGQWKQMLSA